MSCLVWPAPGARRPACLPLPGGPGLLPQTGETDDPVPGCALCRLGGGLLSVGGAANARLSDALHSAVAAATVNFLVGATTLTLVLVLGGFAPVPLERFDGIPHGP